MITVYGINSPSVYRLRAALIFKDLEFEHVSVNLRERSQEFQNLSPAGTIPILQDGQDIIGDGLGAIDYLDVKYPGYKMMGDTPSQMARIKTVIWSVDKIGSYLPPLYLEPMADMMKQIGMSHRALVYDQKAKEDLQRDVTTRLEKLWSYKGDDAFFMNKFSAADAAMLALLGTLSRFGLQIGEKWQGWFDMHMQDAKIASMIPPETEKGIREI